MANSNLSSSQIESPIDPPKAFTNVKVIPPPIIMWFTLSNIFSITVILEETLLPPKMATTGFSEFFNTFSMLSISLASKYPKHLAP